MAGLTESNLLLDIQADPKVADAIFNPLSNTETAGAVLADFGSAIAQNASSLGSNALDLLLNQGDAVIANKFKEMQKEQNPEVTKRMLDILKLPFDYNDRNLVDAVAGEGFLGEARQGAIDNLEQKKEKLSNSRGLTPGGAGLVIGELLGYAPIMKYGTMANTSKAMALGLPKKEIGKALAVDTGSNILTMGASELLLAKAYGKSDEEAMNNAMVAALTGGVGTPLVGKGMSIAKKAGKSISDAANYEEEMLRKNFEEGGSMAGGGRPPDVETKSGTKFESKERTDAKKAVEDIEFDVASPIKGGKILDENTYVPTVKNKKKFRLGYDDRGRIYTEDSNLLSFQGTSDQKATLQATVKREINNAIDEVERRMEFYDNNAKLRKVYGQEQARLKPKDDIPAGIEAFNRQMFLKDQLADIMKNKNLSKNVRNEARKELSRLNKQKIKVSKPSEEVIAKAESRFAKESPVERPSNPSSRDAKLRKEYETFVKNRGDKEGFVREATKSTTESVSNITKKYSSIKTDVTKAIKRISKQELSEGRKGFSVKDITPEIRRRYADDIKMIEDYQNAREDLILYNKKQLSIEELRFREKRRIDERLKRGKTVFEDDPVLDKYLEDVVKELDDIGIYQKKDNIKSGLEVKESTGFKEKPEKKAAREKKELNTAKAIHSDLVKKLMLFAKTGKNRLNKKGRESLSESQIKDVQDGYLTFEEIANKTAPAVINAERESAIKSAREFASSKVNKAIEKELGIKGRFKLPEGITFKDTVKDASNSVAQIVTVLLSSKRMAKLSKLYGGKDDIRSMIGEQLEKQGLKLPKTLGEDGKPMTWKDVVKPLFMTENYGQMEKGLTRNFAKTHKMSYDEASKYVQGYYKAVDDVAPEMKILSKTIYDLIKAGKRNMIEYTLPDGFVVKFNLTKTLDGKIRIQGEDVNIKLVTDDFDEFSRAMMPNLIHSIDGYVASKMNAKGFPSIHDAFVITKGKELEAEKAYTDIMTELNNSNILDDIMRQLGYEGKPLKEQFGDYDSEMIAKSENKLGNEHIAGETEASKLREFDVSTQGTKESVMRDYMASGNYRQIKTNQMIDSMVNEAGYNNEFLKTAKEGDDVFERQVALAMQSPKYNESLAIPVPDGVNKEVWDMTQRNIFNEARAKLEMNPMLNNAIQGDRVFFDKFNKALDFNDKTVQDYIVEEMRILRKLNKSKLREERLKRKQEQVLSKKGSDKISPEDAAFRADAEEAIRQANIPDGNQYKTLWNEQVNNVGAYKEFNDLQTKRNVGRAEVDRDIEALHDKIKSMDDATKQDLEKLVHSDYEAIRGFTKDDADRFWADKRVQDLYGIVKREVDQGAKGLSKQSEQYGAYLSNSHLIATRYGLPKESEDIIDKMISIKAMNDNNAWSSVDNLRGNEDATFVMDLMAKKRKMSEDFLFNESPEKITKGYTSEVYRGNKKINEDGTISYNADDVYEEGILGSDREGNRVGKLVSDDELFAFPNSLSDMLSYTKNKFNIEKLDEGQAKAYTNIMNRYNAGKNITVSQERYLRDLLRIGFEPFENSPKGLAEKLDFMTKNRLRETNGKFRKVAGEDIRLEAGKSTDLADVLSETVRSVNNKLKEQEIVMKVVDDVNQGDSLLYSNVEKLGFVKLTEEQISRLPYSMRDKVLYVNKEFTDRLLGREEVRIINQKRAKKIAGLSAFRKLGIDEQHLLVADRLASNFGTMFKQNVVLKNPVSYLNSFMVNQWIGMSAGISPEHLFRYQTQAMNDLQEMRRLLKDDTYKRLTGKRQIQYLNDKLKDNLLYKMEKAGLSTNRVEGVVGDDDLLSSMLNDSVPSPIFKLGQVLNLNQKTKAGRATLRMYSNIDTMGRYMLAKKFIYDGHSMKDAVHKANGLYGDMDTMVPPAIEMLDKYGFVPFLKWFSKTTPQLLKLTKDNPKKAIAIGIATYIIGQESDTNLHTINPVEAVFDFGMDIIPFETVEKLQKKGLFDTIENRASSNVIPKYLKNAWDSPETLGLHKFRKSNLGAPWSDDSVDYRGTTQQIVESF